MMQTKSAFPTTLFLGILGGIILVGCTGSGPNPTANPSDPGNVGLNPKKQLQSLQNENLPPAIKDKRERMLQNRINAGGAR
jgi:hypothetical protein